MRNKLIASLIVLGFITGYVIVACFLYAMNKFYFRQLPDEVVWHMEKLMGKMVYKLPELLVYLEIMFLLYALAHRGLTDNTPETLDSHIIIHKEDKKHGKN